MRGGSPNPRTGSRRKSDGVSSEYVAVIFFVFANDKSMEVTCETGDLMTKTITTVIVTVGRVRECSIRDAAIYALHGDREALILLTYYI